MDTQAKISYLERQNYHEKFISLCQDIVGSCPVGYWREADIDLIACWQRSKRLKPDGLIGPMTASAIRWDSGIMQKPRRFVWWDSGPVERLGALASWGVERIAIMLNSSSDEHDTQPLWKHRGDRLKRLSDRAAAKGLKRCLTAWVRPNPQQICEVLKYWRAEIPRTGADRIEAELEGNWRAANVHGFESLREAGAALIEGMQALKRDFGVEIVGTTLPWHDEAKGDGATVSPWLDAISVQWYSRAAMETLEDGSKRVKPWYAWDGKQGPGTWQHRGIPKARAAGHNVICGLAGFTKQFPGRGRFDAFEQEFTAAALEDIEEIGIWSSKHANGGTVMADFLAALAKGDAK